MSSKLPLFYLKSHTTKPLFFYRVCLPDSQKSWIAKSFMIKQEISVRYYNRLTGEICDEQQNDNDFVLVSLPFCTYTVETNNYQVEWYTSYLCQYRIKSLVQGRNI